ncbi:hypothetical protein NtRootC7_21290 [Arthrobacter sp. NtRootC7]|nr:hypothetical protein NtRootC7_21290 [Arthrobacter sp. NtRootC7]BCW27530.1 hypothetical protein NtRootC45_21300 [Arthrobacter sp. NtRootC45]BCW31797.1 hypothetical protein NtRootD5_21280 [Arthrobacter sp. NtRootD5]
MHGIAHPVNERQQFDVVELAVVRRGMLTQHRVPGLDDGREFLTIEQPSDGIPDLEGIEICSGA